MDYNDGGNLEYMVHVIEHALETRTKRHIVGGVLLSISALLGGLTLTVMTLKKEEYDE